MSTVVNLFTAIASNHPLPEFLWLSTLLLFQSAIAFAVLSIVMEDCRARAGLADLIYEIRDKKLALSSWFLFAAGYFIAGLGVLLL